MKKRSLTLGILALSMLPFTASAMDFVPDSVAMGYGYFLRNKADLHNYRVGLRWDWNRDWLEYKENLVLTGYTEVAVSYLDSHLATPTTNVESDGQIYAFSFSPVLRLKLPIIYTFLLMPVPVSVFKLKRILIKKVSLLSIWAGMYSLKLAQWQGLALATDYSMRWQQD